MENWPSLKLIRHPGNKMYRPGEFVPLSKNQAVRIMLEKSALDKENVPLLRGLLWLARRVIR